MDEEDLFSEAMAPVEAKKKKSKLPTILVSLGVLLGAGVFGYFYFFTQPAEDELLWEESVTAKSEVWLNGLYEGEGTPDGVVEAEMNLVSEREVLRDFKLHLLSSLKYDYPQEVINNRLGKPLKAKDGSNLTQVSRLRHSEEVVTVTFVDLSKIVLDTASVRELVTSSGLTLDDPEYSVKITELFAQYFLGLEELPTKQEERSIGYTEIGFLEIQEDLIAGSVFSEDVLQDLAREFSVKAAGGESKLLNPAWVVWDNTPLDQREELEEPLNKYNKNLFVETDWFGTRRTGGENLRPQKGDGSKEDPASLGTRTITYIIGEEGVEHDFKISLEELLLGRESLDKLESLDIRNRGLREDSSIQYGFATFRVENVGFETIHISDNSALSDLNANLFGRTGFMYGLKESVILEPGEVGLIETWFSSPDLDKKYLIWGADFSRTASVTWFKVLAAADAADETAYETATEELTELNNEEGAEND